jgi:dsRNA-specific ribonuclease
MISNEMTATEEGTLIHNPYNPINVEITEADVCNILRKYGIPEEMVRVHNIELYKRAFVHPSYTKRPASENEQLGIVIAPKPDNCLSLKSKSFQNLEFLGDGVLELVTKYYIYRRFPKSQEGFKTNLKIAVVKNKSIGPIAAEMGLNKWMLISQQSEDNNVRYDVRKELGNLFEAFLGALFLDFNKVNLMADTEDPQNKGGCFLLSQYTTGAGFQMANIFLEAVFERHINWTEIINVNDNYKQQLQETLQKAFRYSKTEPIYITLDYDKDTNQHTMGVFLCININVNKKYESAEEIMKKVTIDLTKPPTSSRISSISIDALRQHLEDNNGKMLALLGTASQNIKQSAEQGACRNALELFGLL